MMLQERLQKALRMKGIAVFLLALCCCLSGTQGQGDHEDQKACCPSDTGSLMKELISIGEKLGAMGEKLGTMGDNLRLMETRLQTSENEVEELKRLTGGRPQVAFSATLRETGHGNTGPFTTPIPLQYKKVFSNTGSSYNPATGIFTATVKGMYYFRFTMMNNQNDTPNSVVRLTKNGQGLVSVWDTVGTDAQDSGSNAVVIPLEVGDNVYVELQANRLVYDDGMNYNTFSGFLLFTM
ncbi:complement C1q-like protein 2 [Coregonus clupeaformis]|uniref:complement C1q-like protein 2 n=1 Tax=Coregonus clupeaformis TaxID=59861 RepID=UPI001BDF8B93|nr:complement C1q-like protein 2 [Coregonus clupeaformis]